MSATPKLHHEFEPIRRSSQFQCMLFILSFVCLTLCYPIIRFDPRKPYHYKASTDPAPVEFWEPEVKPDIPEPWEDYYYYEHEEEFYNYTIDCVTCLDCNLECSIQYGEHWHGYQNKGNADQCECFHHRHWFPGDQPAKHIDPRTLISVTECTLLGLMQYNITIAKQLYEKHTKPGSLRIKAAKYERKTIPEEYRYVPRWLRDQRRILQWNQSVLAASAAARVQHAIDRFEAVKEARRYYKANRKGLGTW